MLIIAGGIALILITAVRMYTKNCYGGFEIEMHYLIAYRIWRELGIPIIALLMLTGIAKLPGAEKKD